MRSIIEGGKTAGQIVTIHGKRHRMCNDMCAKAFRQDRAMGLIYGPYFHTDPATGEHRQLSGPAEASMLWKCCAYCGRRHRRARARV